MHRSMVIAILIISTSHLNLNAQASELTQLLNAKIKDSKIVLTKVRSDANDGSLEIHIDKNLYLVLTKGIHVVGIKNIPILTKERCENLVQRYHENHPKDVRFKVLAKTHYSASLAKIQAYVEFENQTSTIATRQSQSLGSAWTYEPILDTILRPNRYARVFNIWTSMMSDFRRESDSILHQSNVYPVQREQWFEVDSTFCLAEPCLTIEPGHYNVKVSNYFSYDHGENFPQTDAKSFFDSLLIAQKSDSILKSKLQVSDEIKYDRNRSGMQISIASFNKMNADSIIYSPIEQLHIWGQSAPFVSDVIYNLDRLEEIRIDTEIQLLPPGLHKLRNLVSLAVNSDLICLPKKIHKASTLVNLDLMGNELRYLTPKVRKLKSIQTLKLGHNKLIKIPRSIRSLSELSSLSLHNNKLEKLPKSFGSLSKLMFCSVQGNNLKNLDFNGHTLDSLKFFDLARNRLESIPLPLLRIPHLRHLILDQNSIQIIPDDISALDSLYTLSLNKNKIMELPESIGGLTNLYSLRLSNNKITKLPDTLKNLTNLRELNLIGNEIDTADIDMLKQSLPDCNITY